MLTQSTLVNDLLEINQGRNLSKKIMGVLSTAFFGLVCLLVGLSFMSTPIVLAQTPTSTPTSTPNWVGPNVALITQVVGGVNDFVIQGNRAYGIGDDKKLIIFDLSSGTNPKPIGTLLLPDIGLSIQVVGTKAYIATSGSGFRIIDISIPSTPKEIGFYDTPGLAHELFVRNNMVFLVDGNKGLQIYDVTTPTNVKLVGSFSGVWTYVGVQVAGNYAYITGGYTYECGHQVWWWWVSKTCTSGGLEIIDISKPATPTWVSKYLTVRGAYGIKVIGNYIYLMDNQDGLRIVDISNPAKPTLVGQYPTSDAFHVEVIGGYAYISTLSNGVIVVDVRDVTKPTLAAAYLPPAGTRNYKIAVANGLIYKADRDKGLFIFKAYLTPTLQISHTVALTEVLAGKDITYTVKVDGTGFTQTQFLTFSVHPSVTLKPVTGWTLNDAKNQFTRMITPPVNVISVTFVGTVNPKAILGTWLSSTMAVNSGSLKKEAKTLTIVKPYMAISQQILTNSLWATSTAVVKAGDILTYVIRITNTNGTLPVLFTETLPIGVKVIGTLHPSLTYTNNQIRFRGLVTNTQVFTLKTQVNREVKIPSILPAALVATTQFSGTGYEHRAETVLTVPNRDFVNTLVIFYLSVDDEKLNNEAGKAIIGLRDGCKKNEFVTCMVYVDWYGPNNAYFYNLGAVITTTNNCPSAADPTCGTGYQLDKTVWKWQDDNSTSVGNLTEVIKRANSAYPNADRVILRLVGHGGVLPVVASLPNQPAKREPMPGLGFMFDTYPNGAMTMLGIAEAIAKAGVKINLLMLDGCDLASMEALNDLQNTADYLLASESWAWAMWPYEEDIMAIDSQKTSEEIGRAWVANYQKVVPNDYPFTLSLFRLRDSFQEPPRLFFPPLVQSFNTWVKTLSNTTTIPKLGDLRKAATCFHNELDTNEKSPFITNLDSACDLGSLAMSSSRLFPDNAVIQTATDRILEDIANLVIAETHHSGTVPDPKEVNWTFSDDVRGISLFFPFARKTALMEFYKPGFVSLAEDTHLDELIKVFWNDPNSYPPCKSCGMPLLPDLNLPELKIPQLVVGPNMTVTVPISWSSDVAVRLGSFNITLTYDPTKATFIQAEASSKLGSPQIQVQNDSSGLIRIVAVVANSLPITNIALVNLKFKVLAPWGEGIPLTFLRGLTQTVVYSSTNLFKPLNIELTSGDLVVGGVRLGDVNEDMVINAADAGLALQIVTKIIASPTSTQRQACDVNQDNVCNAADATLILCTSLTQDLDMCQKSRMLRSGELEKARLCLSPIQGVGSQTLMLHAQGIKDMAGLSATLSYDPTQLTINGIQTTSLTQDFIMSSNSSEPGMVYIAMAHRLPVNEAGSWLELTVTSKSPTATLTLSEVNLNNDVGQDFVTALHREVEISTCKPETKTYLPLVVRR